jgi:hypothetical protein
LIGWLTLLVLGVLRCRLALSPWLLGAIVGIILLSAGDRQRSGDQHKSGPQQSEAPLMHRHGLKPPNRSEQLLAAK